LSVKTFSSQFVERDRIQSGLSSAVVVIESDLKSGTMHTANFCVEQGRKLACIDYKPEYRSKTSQGNELLLFEGKAIPLEDANDKNLQEFIANVFGTVR
jgi:predicted Rossmann fold nucleotide-binding protein DprA/Smf involved in DNA uptake